MLQPVYFPWPHLLFSEEVFTDFHADRGLDRTVDYFHRLGYGIHMVWPSKPWWDESFYQRFHWKLGRYPRWDLQHDFIHALLTKHPDANPRAVPDA